MVSFIGTSTYLSNLTATESISTPTFCLTYLFCSFGICFGICSCGHIYLGETIRNGVTRIDEHEQPNGKSESSKHLKINPGHKLDWMTLSRAPSHCLKRKIIEAYFIEQLNPSLNHQLDSELLILFRNGVT